MPTVLLTATVQSHICQFHRPLAQMLHERGFRVEVAARDNLKEKNGLKLDFADAVHDICFARSPFSPRNIKAYRALCALLRGTHYDYIHCNTPVAGVLTRLAARKYRKTGTVVVYTAHGFHFYSGAPLKNWLVYYPVEKLCARFTDKLITITAEDEALAKKRFHPRVYRVHGVGADGARFFPVDMAKRDMLRKELGYGADEKLALCVGELLPNKNQATAIRAFAALRESIPEAKLLIAGNGPELESLKALVLQTDCNADFLGYRTDIEKFDKICDVCLTCSYREGLPLNVMEAMLCEKPVIASVNRGHRELVENGVTGMLLAPDDIAGFTMALESILGDAQAARSMGKAGALSAAPFTAGNVVRELEEVYFA